MKNANVSVNVQVISAGKLRRYAHLTFWQHLTVPKVVTSNTADMFKVSRGFMQSIALLRRFKPDVVFAKGGFVCLPVGMAAKALKIPLVIHDSDTRPGLTNKILSRWADVIATGSPLENYSYPASKSHYIGVPIDQKFSLKSEGEQRRYKQMLGFDPDKPLVVATGGGLGAQSINEAMIARASDILSRDTGVYLVAGKRNYDSLMPDAPQDTRFKIVPFVYEAMDEVLGAADIVVSRGSATTLQELAGLGKATVIVPAHQLGDQMKNAAMYAEAEAGVIIDNERLAREPSILSEAIAALVTDVSQRTKLASNLHAFARPNAASDLARLIVCAVRKR